jgi:hypothetical protein
MNQPARRVLFRVQRPDEGRECIIYADGETEGFGDGRTCVVNLFPELCNHAIHVDRLQRDSENGISSNPSDAAICYF